MIIDANTSLGHWPFRRFPAPTAAAARALARRLGAAGIGRALVFSAEAVLHPDPRPCDEDLRRAVRGFPSLVPVPTVNPTLSDWPGILEAGGPRAVAAVPNYHDYRLDSPAAARLMEALAVRGIPLVVRLRLDDERNQYRLMKVPGVDCARVIALARAFPGVPVVCLGAYRGEAVELLSRTDNISVDISFVSGFRALASLAAAAPSGRVLFGSHTPFFYTEPALLKLASADLSPGAREAIARRNAASLFNLSP